MTPYYADDEPASVDVGTVYAADLESVRYIADLPYQPGVDFEPVPDDQTGEGERP